jgi:dolichol-phosphate mannosyltransferase
MTTVLAMPCYNEADGISEFLDEIIANLDDVIDYIVVVNDFSTDSTLQVLESYSEKVEKLKVYSNVSNLGHGPTFLSAINHAFSFDPTIIVTVDGDGQFKSKEIKERIVEFKKSELDLLECARTSRTDPFFRKIVTFLLRFLVWTRVGERPLDANTPLRIYRANVLFAIIQEVPRNSLIPNLRISTLTRRKKYKYAQRRVVSLQRRGLTASGTTWETRREWLPSKRFIKFCRSAILELWRHPF